METEIANQPKAKTQLEIAAALQTKALHDDLFNVMCYLFAHRQRTRKQVQLNALKRTVEAEGADFLDKEYQDALKFLASLGIGTIRYNSKGKMLGLYDIKYTLQSVGQAAANKRATLETTSSRRVNKFQDLIPASKPKLDFIEKPQEKAKRDFKVSLTIMIKGTPVVLEGPDNLRAEDVGAYIATFNNLTKIDKK